ncbi:MAG TPA: peptide deformylase [Myxococcales bacterium]|nr:peptide deformylase [Myxococcales bacterium]HIK85389.1 peptide deformylase [Myxococcales bacterium]
MALREIVKFPDPRLKEVSKPITEVDDTLRELARDMIDVMYDEPGIGLAAPQVGASIRMFVIDTEWSDEEVRRNPVVVLNPEISDPEDKIIWEEGCLSVPDYSANVERDAKITLRGIDLDGNPIEEHAEGLRAVCIQHEVDHLDGILFIDRISRLKRGLYVKKRKKQLLDEED